MCLSCPGMKLARPDIFHPRIVLTGPGEDAGVVGALRHRGLHAPRLSWEDPRTRDADLEILRAAHDCDERLDEFLAWTTGVANLLNPPDAVAWNLGERYLRGLERAGVPTLQGKPESQTALIFLGGAASPAFTGAGPVEPEFEGGGTCCAARAEAAARARN